MILSSVRILESKENIFKIAALFPFENSYPMGLLARIYGILNDKCYIKTVSIPRR
jgi:hypothetical protein